MAQTTTVTTGQQSIPQELMPYFTGVDQDYGILPKAQEIFARVTDRTFNRIDSDGCTSTNDTVLFMSSGASGVEVSDSQLEVLLIEVCGSLAGQLIADAEGSTTTVAIEVIGADSESDAVEVARACARNNLLKCAIFGGDPNWGRVLAAVGTTQVTLNPLDIDVTLNGVQVAKSSAPFEDRNKVSFEDRLVTIQVNLKIGTAGATVFTNDLSHDYVHENSAYAT
jgi:glutamate N-acetyltransferase/amino-acid N-acetyltransferase